jgi:hypothetical protein
MPLMPSSGRQGEGNCRPIQISCEFAQIQLIENGFALLRHLQMSP